MPQRVLPALKLTYPVAQNYRLQRVQQVFYGGSFVLIAMLVFMNVILSGYDTAVVLLPDPNVTDYDQWWAPKFLPKVLRLHTKPADCDEQKLQMGLPYRTNSSLPLFSYTLSNNYNRDILAPSTNDGRVNRGGETPYRANPLDTCRIRDMYFLMDIRMLSFSIDAFIACNNRHSWQFRTSFKRAFIPRYSPDTIMQYMEYTSSQAQSEFRNISQNGPTKNTFLNVLGVLDMLGTELTKVIQIRRYMWQHARRPLPEIARADWNILPPNWDQVDMSLLRSSTYMSGTWHKQDPFLSEVNRTVVNMFAATRNAILLDLGRIQSTNIFLNKSAFNQQILPDPIFPRLVSQRGISFPNETEGMGCCWVWGCLDNFNASWAETLRSTDQPVNNLTLPIDTTTPLFSSVLDMMYLCPQYRRKSGGSLLIAVFTGTFAMYSTIYQLFTWLASSLDEKYYGERPWERVWKQVNDSGRDWARPEEAGRDQPLGDTGAELVGLS